MGDDLIKAVSVYCGTRGRLERKYNDTEGHLSCRHRSRQC